MGRALDDEDERERADRLLVRHDHALLSVCRAQAVEQTRELEQRDHRMQKAAAPLCTCRRGARGTCLGRGPALRHRLQRGGAPCGVVRFSLHRRAPLPRIDDAACAALTTESGAEDEEEEEHSRAEHPGPRRGNHFAPLWDSSKSIQYV